MVKPDMESMRLLPSIGRELEPELFQGPYVVEDVQVQGRPAQYSTSSTFKKLHISTSSTLRSQRQEGKHEQAALLKKKKSSTCGPHS
jgi:hypothetical protein